MTGESSLPRVILAIDPGRQKCGLAAVRADGVILGHEVVSSEEIVPKAAEWAALYRAHLMIIGNGTGSQPVRKRLETQPSLPPMIEVQEKDTTRQARSRYFRDNPPRGWRRLIPLGLQTPPRPIDDYAAILLAEAYWRRGSG
ncbi:MAG: hypothetical protein IT210_00230 [Armatimonadetes bacterium]|nr:hypothetical protein [Armatimonadota bacterium]